MANSFSAYTVSLTPPPQRTSTCLNGKDCCLSAAARRYHCRYTEFTTSRLCEHVTCAGDPEQERCWRVGRHLWA